ncbi:MAG: nicotinate-nucleotide adenylyltransferase [Bacteroidales bacterium]|nr:nicotinate-nucleotide adenylyltransferase [Bacteroidales bacterium]
MKIGLYFGSFNPVHIGHMALANYMVEYSDIEKLWFVLSPHNPFKRRSSLLDEYQRYQLLNLATNDDSRFEVSNIEFKLPKPSMTIDTLTYLVEKYPQHEFVLIIGADNAEGLKKWKNAELLLSKYSFLIYPREGIILDNIDIPNYQIVDAPQINISSSFIRQAIKNKHDVRFFMPESSYQYLKEMHFYEK